MIEGTNVNIHESKNKIESAAREICNSPNGITWNLPPAVIIELPGGVMAGLNGDPEQVGRTLGWAIKELVAAPRDEDET